MNIIFQVRGGIGKTIMSTAVISALKSKILKIKLYQYHHTQKYTKITQKYQLFILLKILVLFITNIVKIKNLKYMV